MSRNLSLSSSNYAHCLGSTKEPTPLPQVWVSQFQINEDGRAVPITLLWQHGQGRFTLPIPILTAYHPHYLSVPEPGVRTESEVTITARELSLPPPTATFGRAGPVPHLGNTVQPTMLVKLRVNQTQTEM